MLNQLTLMAPIKTHGVQVPYSVAQDDDNSRECVSPLTGQICPANLLNMCHTYYCSSGMCDRCGGGQFSQGPEGCASAVETMLMSTCCNAMNTDGNFVHNNFVLPQYTCTVHSVHSRLVHIQPTQCKHPVFGLRRARPPLVCATTCTAKRELFSDSM